MCKTMGMATLAHTSLPLLARRWFDKSFIYYSLTIC